MVLRLTDKLRKDLRIRTLVRDVPAPATFLDDWTATLFFRNRQKLILFLNSKTLFCFLVRKQPKVGIVQAFKDGLRAAWEREWLDGKYIDSILNASPDAFTFGANSDRRVTGTINDMKRMYLDGWLADAGANPSDEKLMQADEGVRRTPFSLIEMHDTVVQTHLELGNAFNPVTRIDAYLEEPVMIKDWDRAFPIVAQQVIKVIQQEVRIQGFRVWHIGSTAVRGCAGKGVIDLMTSYRRPEELSEINRAVAHVGFQRQTGSKAFPEERPMRKGAVQFQGKTYRVHAHVLPGESEEGREMIRFRNLLEKYPLLRSQYEAAKNQLVGEGVTDSVDYSECKGEVVRRILDSTDENPNFW